MEEHAELHRGYVISKTQAEGSSTGQTVQAPFTNTVLALSSSDTDKFQLPHLG